MINIYSNAKQRRSELLRFKQIYNIFNPLITLLICLRTRNTENEFLQGVLLITFHIVFQSILITNRLIGVASFFGIYDKHVGLIWDLSCTLLPYPLGTIDKSNICLSNVIDNHKQIGCKNKYEFYLPPLAFSFFSH